MQVKKIWFRCNDQILNESKLGHVLFLPVSLHRCEKKSITKGCVRIMIDFAKSVFVGILTQWNFDKLKNTRICNMFNIFLIRYAKYQRYVFKFYFVLIYWQSSVHTCTCILHVLAVNDLVWYEVLALSVPPFYLFMEVNDLFSPPGNAN